MSIDPLIVPKGPSILVVGPDGVGKTTVCAHMSRMTGIPIWKCPVEKQIFKGTDIFGHGKSLVFDYQLTNFLEQTGFRVISDRAYICEAVYSEVFGRKTDSVLLELIDQRHGELGTKILYMYSSVQPTVEDDIIPAEKYFAVKEGYDSFVERSACDVLSVDTAQMLAEYRAGGDISEEIAAQCWAMLDGVIG